METIDSLQDSWGGRAAVDWTARLADSNKFDPEIAHIIEVARLLDWIYKRKPEVW